ncbi:MAG: HAMP domain-containing histidine kinase [Deltaproteobacteria bacterium]|nr:HAMP domain-containing histidine kinase [Deltaproteobacteria bacterium]
MKTRPARRRWRRLRVRDLEALARDAQRDTLAARRSLDSVMAVVSHDLRSPIGTITMGASLLREYFTRHGAEATRELNTLGRMERACRSMLSQMSDLQDVARIDAGTFRVELRPVGVNDILREATDAAQLQAQLAGVDVRFEAADEGLELELDRQRIQQALGNLVVNALRVTPRGGLITLKVEPVEGFVRFSVVDAGAGLEPEFAAHAFDRYWQASAGLGGSTGVRLFIVRSIAEAHGGRAEVQSAPGLGSTFSLLLPWSRQAP